MSSERDYSLISVAGSYHTGSSALLDLLCGYSGLHVIRGEFSPFERGLFPLLRELHAGRPVAQQELDRIEREVLAYERESRLGYWLLSRGTRVARHFLPARLRDSAWLKRHDRLSGISDFHRLMPAYAEATSEFFRRLSKMNRRLMRGRRLKRSRLRRALRTWFDELFDLPEDVLPVVDQLIKPRTVALSRLFPFARIFIVTRDPRDQFCDIVNTPMTQPRYRGRDRVHRFLEDYQRRYRREEKIFARERSNVMRVAFEDLVTAPETTRGQVECFLGMEGQWNPESSRLKPEESRQRVGMFVEHSDPSEIQEIERVLAFRLYPGLSY